MRADGSAKRLLSACRCSAPAWAPAASGLSFSRTRAHPGFSCSAGAAECGGPGPESGLVARWQMDRVHSQGPPPARGVGAVQRVRDASGRGGDPSTRAGRGAGLDAEWRTHRVSRRAALQRDCLDSPQWPWLAPRRRFRRPDPQNSAPSLPTNAPTGRLIAFSKGFANDPNWIWLMRADGSERRRIFSPDRWATSANASKGSSIAPHRASGEASSARAACRATTSKYSWVAYTPGLYHCGGLGSSQKATSQQTPHTTLPGQSTCASMLTCG